MILTLKLLLTPVLITAATLAGRRWGPGVSGWLVGFPLTSGPVSLILALQYGPEFAARAAIGSLGGLASISAYCLTYSVVSQGRDWFISAIMAVVTFFLATFFWSLFALSLLPTLVIALIIDGLVIRLIPQRAMASADGHRPRWDLQGRMIIATTFVIVLTTFASVLGPQLSGLITPFPVFATVLAAFAHRQQGADAAAQFLRGHASSLFGFAGFFLVVGGLLLRAGIVWTYVVAAMVAVAVNGVVLRLVHQGNTRLYQQV